MSFFGLNVARSGLFAAQKALETVGHNVTNANTPGYTRQRVVQNPSTPISTGWGKQGTGVDVVTVEQIRNVFLDFKYRRENTKFGEAIYRHQSLSMIEDIYNEPSETSIRKVSDNLFDAFQELSKAVNSNTSKTQRVILRETSISYAKEMNNKYTSLQKMLKDTNEEVTSSVKQINSYAKDIASLNKQISDSEMNGHKANDLRDQRNLLLDKLSELVSFEQTEVKNVEKVEDGKFVNPQLRISINGVPLVSHDDVNELELVENVDHPGNLLTDTKINNVKFKSGEMIDPTTINGVLKSQLDMRDSSSNPKGIPYYIDTLNRYITTFANELNAQHMKGYGLEPGSTGIPFFVADKVGYEMMPDGPKFPLTIDGNTIADKTALDAFINSQPGATTADKLEKANELFSKSYKGYALDGAGSAADPYVMRDKTGPSFPLKIAGVSLKNKTDLKNYIDGLPGATTADKISVFKTEFEKTYKGYEYNATSADYATSFAPQLNIQGYVDKESAKGRDIESITADFEKSNKGYTIFKHDGKWEKVTRIDASNIKLSTAIDADPDKIAVATDFIETDKGRVAKEGDNKNIQAMWDLRQKNDMFTWGSPEDYIKAAVSNLGVDAQETESLATNQTVLLMQVNKERQEVSGVSLDEEMGNMIKFQHAYNASARMVTAMDEMIDIVVNRMGRVGL